MRTLAEVKARCIVEGKHWIWQGALSAGLPNIYVPDYTDGGKMKSQRGARAVWHIKNKQPIPNGYRVFCGCDEPLCVSPHCVKCMPCSEWGKEVAESGEWRGNVKRIAANRRTGQARSKLSAEKVTLILLSEKTGRELSQELGVSRTSISRIRSGHPVAFTPVGGLFTGLMA
jgi:hypothetical protein